MLAPLLVAISLAALWFYGRSMRLRAGQTLVLLAVTALCLTSALHSVAFAAAYCALAIALLVIQRGIPEEWRPYATVVLLGAAAAVLLQGHREPLWSSPASLPMIGVFGAIVLAARNGLSGRRAYSAIVFVVALIAAMEDARLAPFFAMAAAPLAIEAGLP